MGFDDPVVWILIVAVVVFLFGASRIPQFARSLGSARREFEQAWRGGGGAPTTMNMQQTPVQTNPMPTQSTNTPVSDDPVIVAARNEGIVTEGKTRQQIASELAWKLKQKESA